jgi:hypothetical protein
LVIAPPDIQRRSTPTLIATTLIVHLACRHAPDNSTIGNRATAPPADAAPNKPCDLYEALYKKATACTALSKEVRDILEQRHSDHVASIAENGLDGSHYDADEGCTSETAELQRVAAKPCGW